MGCGLGKATLEGVNENGCEPVGNVTIHRSADKLKCGEAKLVGGEVGQLGALEGNVK